jgi:RimJ/RimL family protein N-acetyltransferase
MNPSWTIQTGRLAMRPVSYADLPELIALKADPQVFAVMLGGVRMPERTAEELAEDISFWGAHGVGMWAVRAVPPAAPAASPGQELLGYVGLHQRPDGRGIALRFAFVTAARGRGYAAEAAGAALRFGHQRGGLARIIAVAREDNIGSRQVLGGIGMVECETYLRGSERMIVYESRWP